MDNRKILSRIFLGIGLLLIVYGFYRINSSPESHIAGHEDSAGMTILSIGAVVAIFSTGSMVGNQEQ